MLAKTVEILEMPVGGWARWMGTAGAVVGFLAGIFSLVMLFVSPEAYTSTISRVVFGYAAPLTFAVIWGAFGAFGGAMLASTYNHVTSVFGGIKVRGLVTDDNEPDA